MHTPSRSTTITFDIFLGAGPAIGFVTVSFLIMEPSAPWSALLPLALLAYPVGAIPAVTAAFIFLGLLRLTERLSANKTVRNLLSVLYGSLAGALSTCVCVAIVSPGARRAMPFKVVVTGVIAGALCAYISSRKWRDWHGSQGMQ
jgi:hypothetical protein